jgi:hypothetical protein
MTSILFKLILGVSLIVIVIVFGPILTIWSLNTLFPALAIPYTLETWAAAALLFTTGSIFKFAKTKND